MPKCYTVSMGMLGMDLHARNYATEIGVFETEFKIAGS